MGENHSAGRPAVNGHPPEDDDAAEVSELPPEGGLAFEDAVEQQEGLSLG